ncbi:transketolase, partial [Candidatus Peregrinibacteria bacterium]|nr:transketolase [Candidatus Peregrinibacteria bacterium]
MATVSTAEHPLSIADLQEKSRVLRCDIFTMAHRAKSGHLGSAFSIVDILTVLYFRRLAIDPAHPRDPDRDRFILSKGHGCAALYVALAHRGFFPTELLVTHLQDGSTLAGHPSSRMVPGVDASTGSLGHGLGIGLGMALVAKRDGKAYRTFVLISDGECDEGSTWEAILAASQWKLSSLTCIVDYNKIQSFGRVGDVMELEPFAEKWRAFGWNVQETDGHDHAAMRAAVAAADKETERPSVIIAHTVKGKGVSFM